MNQPQCGGCTHDVAIHSDGGNLTCLAFGVKGEHFFEIAFNLRSGHLYGTKTHQYASG